MEIIHVVLGKANPDRMNGVNKVVYQLATKQAEFGEKVSVWGITSDNEKNYGTRSFNTELFIKKSNPFAVPDGLEEAMISKKGKAIFHVHGGWIPVFYSIGKLLKKHELPFVFTPHGAYNTIAMNSNFIVKRLYFLLFEKPMLECANKIHCIGKSETIGLRNFYKNKKTILVPYGFENNVEVSFKTVKNENVIFGFVGRLDIYTKGLDTLISAFKRFVDNGNPNAQLWIIGDSKEKVKLNTMVVKNKLNHNVVLLGGKFGLEKEALLREMDIFVHPSRNEGLPTSVIEAASFGKPCIVTDATNIGDLIMQYHAGEMIFLQSVEELEMSMIKLATIWKNDEDFSIICNNAIKMVKDNFNWKKVILEFNDKLYKL